MGIKERRRAQKEALQKDILTVTRALFKKEGSWQAVTMRKIAEAIDYSLPTLYEYFKNKEDLLKVLQQEGYLTLCNTIKSYIQNAKKDPQTLLLSIAEAYWDFAFENPELYLSMHDPNFCIDDFEESIVFIRKTVKHGLQELLNEKKLSLSAAALDNKLDAQRGIIHGFIMLGLSNNMKKEHAHMIMIQTLNDSIKITS